MLLLEREPQLAALDDWAADAAAARGRLVLVAGEAGVGKTALVDAFRARHPDARQLQGACDGLFTPRPLGPVIDVAESVGGELGRLARTPGTAREQLFAALLRELVTGPAPGILVVEDVHWADRATLDLLHFLCRRLSDKRAMVVVTYRDDGAELAPDLRRTLGDLVTCGVTRRVTVPPLTRAAVAELTRASGVGADDLYRLTGGNPFFLTEALRAVSGHVPPTAREAVLSRVVDLAPDARRLLDVAALLGTHVPLDLLAEVAGPTGPGALDELVAQGVVGTDGEELNFRHEIARLAVAEAVPAHRATTVHRAALAALYATGCTDDARLAHHAEGAGDATAVRRHAPSAAATAARLGAHRQAVEQYGRALRFADDADPSARAHLLDRLAVELGVVDSWEEACAAAEEALAIWESVGDDLRAGDTCAHLARAYWRMARGADSTRAVERSVALLEPLGPTPELARALAMMASHHMTGWNDREALIWATRARELLEELDDPATLSDLLDTEACVRAALGEDGVPLMRRALDLAVAGGHHPQAGRAYANLIGMLEYESRLEEAVEVSRAGLDYSDEHDVGTYSRCIRGGYARVLTTVGQWTAADRVLADLLLMASSPENRIEGLVVAGGLAARRGQDDAATVHLDEALASALGTGEAQFLLMTRLARAEAGWLVGDPEAAALEIAEALPFWELLDPVDRGKVATWARRLGVESPTDDVAEPWATQLVDPAAAVPVWDALGRPYDAALAAIDSGTEEYLREALSRLDPLGATATARLVRRRLRDAGARSIPAGVRSTTRANPHGLTAREQEVLDRIAAGMANTDIAADLVISPKTVERHVSAVLAKLGVADRRRAAEVVARTAASEAPLPTG